MSCLSQKSRIAAMSSRESVAPVGLHGKFKSTAFVFGVTFFSSSSTVRRNSSSTRVSTQTGTAWARRIVGAYDTKHGSW